MLAVSLVFSFALPPAFAPLFALPPAFLFTLLAFAPLPALLPAFDAAPPWCFLSPAPPSACPFMMRTYSSTPPGK